MLFTLLLFMSFSSCFGEEQGYAVFDSETGTLTFKYGTPTGTAGTDYYKTDNTYTNPPGWKNKRSSIKKVVFDSSFADARPKSCYYWFYECKNLTVIDGIEYLNTSEVTDMSYMFSRCSSLTSLDVSNFNTEKVTNMYSIFSNCSGLTSLDLSNFNTANVTTMSWMFWGCSGLTSVTFGENFTTANVTDMGDMFSGCSSLTSLDVSHFDTANVTYISRMFYNCSSLTSLTFGENFSTAKAVRWRINVFDGCSKLRYIDFYASKNVDAIKSVDRNNEGDIFYRVLKTTVIYLPKGSQAVSNVVNVVYSYNGDGNNLRCPNYYSEDKVDIEFPREFKTAKAEYSRTMSNNYGSVVLPYDFTTDANIQAYTLDEEHTETMFFKDATTVAAHTPFAFKKLQSGNTADFVMTDEGFGITVKATHTTSAKEGGAPYTHSENLGGWTTKGYYINETVTDYTGAFYIAGDKFYKASDDLTLYPHRVTFHGAWTKSGTSGDARFYNINTVSDSETITAIEAADLRHTRSVAAEVYDVAGRRLPEMVKGLNIVRMNDGRVRKVSIR